MTVSEAIITWLKTFKPNGLWDMQTINTDVMHSTVDYALVKEPIRNVKRYISGTEIITEHYQLRAKLDSTNDTDSVENGAWLEQLTDWVETKNKNKEFPLLADVKEVGIASPFYVGRTEDKKAIYQLTIFITFRKGN